MGQPRVVLLEAGVKTFATGLLPDLITSLRACAPGDLLRISATDSSSIGAELESWCRVTRNSIVEVTRTSAATSWVNPLWRASPELPTGAAYWVTPLALC
jgi:TusA-related sulfurtransferase